MGRLFVLAGRKPRAFAVIEFVGVVLLCLLGGLILPTFTATAPPPAETTPAEESTGVTAQPVIADGSVRKIRFNVNASPPRRPPTQDSRPLDGDY
jgi:hypothetical protein